MHHIRVRRLGAVVAFAAAVAAPAFADETADTLAAMRAATDRYRDVDAALADGYLRDPMNHCFTAEMMGMPPEWGVMGIHYFRPDLLGVTATAPKVDGNGLHLDFNQPSILIYEPQADGSLELVAVENLVFEAPGKPPATPRRPPSSAAPGTPCSTTRRPPPSTRPTASPRTTTSTSGSTATTPRAPSNPSTRRHLRAHGARVSSTSAAGKIAAPT